MLLYTLAIHPYLIPDLTVRTKTPDSTRRERPRFDAQTLAYLASMSTVKCKTQIAATQVVQPK